MLIHQERPSRHLIGRYHEIALKGRNQWRFVQQLKSNLKAAFADLHLGPIRSEGPRLLVELPADLDDRIVAERAATVFGLQNFSIGYPVKPDIEIIKRESVELAKRQLGQRFRVRTRRSDKRFPLNSMAVDRLVGAEIKQVLGLEVDLEEPDFTVEVEIGPERTDLSAGKIPGAGGLPTGVSGQALALLSGGIDSPVAAYRMMRRGLRCDFVHFHSFPLLSSASREKASELALHLTRYQAHSTLTAVPFADVQREIVGRTRRPLRVVLYRRFMLRIASALARKSGAQALITGESLGQVASQTLENITVIGQATAYPVLRPLIGMDKNEIVEQARALGTFEISIVPDQDCCTLFTPAHPETRARLSEVQALESQFAVERMVDDSVAKSQVEVFHFPAIEARAHRPGA